MRDAYGSAEFGGTDEGLRVWHIAAFDLLTCSLSENVEEASSGKEFNGIDQIPIMDGERTVAVWEAPVRVQEFVRKNAAAFTPSAKAA